MRPAPCRDEARQFIINNAGEDLQGLGAGDDPTVGNSSVLWCVLWCQAWVICFLALSSIQEVYE